MPGTYKKHFVSVWSSFVAIYFQTTLNCLMPFYAILMISKSLYYPIKDLFGEPTCYITTYVELFLLYLAQFQTFFITLYRYICLFHDDMLLHFNIHPKSLAKIMVISLFIISFLTSFYILFGTELVVHLESCLVSLLGSR